jgi:sortase B
MAKTIRRIIMAVLAVIFIASMSYIIIILYQYKKSDEIYGSAVDRYIMTEDGSDIENKTAAIDEESTDYTEAPPISVDFDELRKVNPDIVGWLYCEDSVINYPVVKGSDNDYYLHHAYDGTYSASGAIFIDEDNADDFQDSNTIIYGHHMKNGSMFATLSNWGKQEYFDSHSVMWLLTPEQNYKIILFSGYTTSAYSDTYRIFREPGDEFTQYIINSAQYSDFAMRETELYADAKYVLLSTCAYVFDNARYVIHGMLVPVD